MNSSRVITRTIRRTLSKTVADQAVSDKARPLIPPAISVREGQKIFYSGNIHTLVAIAESEEHYTVVIAPGKYN